MKTRLLRPWHIGIVLLAALPAVLMLRARGQSAPLSPQPALKIPAASPPAVVAPPQLPPPAPARTVNPQTTVATPRAPVKPLQTASKLPTAQGVSSAQYYIEKMAAITFPAVQFQEASAEEAIEFLRFKSRDYDTIERDPGKKGVNIILKPGATAPQTKITLDLKEVPMSEALKYITQLAGMAYKIEPYAVVVMPLTEWNSEIKVRTFKVPADFLTANATAEHQTAVDILTAHGIRFPDGASATFLPSSSSLVVRNTEPELSQVEMLLDSFVHVPAAPQTSSTSPRADNLVNQASIVTVPGGAPPLTVMPPAATFKPTQIIAVEGGQLRAMAPGGDLFFEANSLDAGGSVAPVLRPATSTRAEQILRDAELRVLMRHFETTVSEITDGEKALLLEVDAAKQGALETRIKALRDWKARLVSNINGLTGAAAIAGDKLEIGATYTTIGLNRVPAPAAPPSNTAAQKQRAQARAAEQETKLQQRRTQPNAFEVPPTRSSATPAATPRTGAGDPAAPAVPGIGVGAPATQPRVTPNGGETSGNPSLEDVPILGRLFQKSSAAPLPETPGVPAGSVIEPLEQERQRQLEREKAKASAEQQKALPGASAPAIRPPHQ
jgi:hypothetical protein